MARGKNCLCYLFPLSEKKLEQLLFSSSTELLAEINFFPLLRYFLCIFSFFSFFLCLKVLFLLLSQENGVVSQLEAQNVRAQYILQASLSANESFVFGLQSSKFEKKVRVVVFRFFLQIGNTLVRRQNHFGSSIHVRFSGNNLRHSTRSSSILLLLLLLLLLDTVL